MATRREPDVKRPDLPPERAISALRRQLSKLQEFKGKNFKEVEAAEMEWSNFTFSIYEHAFGNPSSSLSKFNFAQHAGNHYITPYGPSPQHLQQNFEARIQAFEAALNSSISELELFLPETELKGVYEPGDQYAFYKDLTSILTLGQIEVFIVDNYLDSELFDVYVARVDPHVSIRVLTDLARGPLVSVAQKFALRGGFELRTSNDVHDRAVFVDDRCWVIGQSIKDAAKKKPTYIVEHTSSTMKPIYEEIWSRATPTVKG